MSKHAHHQPAVTSVTAIASQAISGEPATTPLAGQMALHIAEIATRHGKLSALAGELTSYLFDTLGADTVALFWYRSREGKRGRMSRVLHPVGIACHAAANADQSTQRLKPTAYRALSRSAPITRPAMTASSTFASTRSFTIGLPIGTNAPWAVLVAQWRTTNTAVSEHAALLDQLRPALTIATRPARVLDEAAHADHLQSPRRTVFAVTSEAIATLDEDFIIREINPAFTKILGWTQSATIGSRCSDVIRCRDERRMLLCDTPRCPLRQAFDTDEPSSVRDLTWETQSGKPCEVSASFTVQRIEQPTGAVIVARDVSLLNAANRMRANFISMVSHELRTPLNSINGFLEIVLESPVGPLNERQREFLTYARVSTQQLTTLVEDILFISKADSGQFTLRLGRVRVPKVVEQALQTIQSLSEAAQVKIVAEVAHNLPLIRADELRIQQVLTNLLGNAIKFSPSQSTVRLTVTPSDSTLLFAVSDQGKGIAPEDHARIFERFYQSDADMRNRAGGYGLGLSIAKLIVEQHHGRIWVESEPTQGATFYFTIPVNTIPLNVS